MNGNAEDDANIVIIVSLRAETNRLVGLTTYLNPTTTWIVVIVASDCRASICKEHEAI